MPAKVSILPNIKYDKFINLESMKYQNKIKFHHSTVNYYLNSFKYKYIKCNKRQNNTIINST